MAQTLCAVVSAEDRQRLAAIVGDRNSLQKDVARARIVLLSAERLDVAAIARGAGISRPAVWRWQRRYAAAGVDGLLRDRTRKPGKPALGEAVAHRTVALTCTEPPGEATHSGVPGICDPGVGGPAG
jgi:transposase-like protein